MKTIEWSEGSLKLLDQVLLPLEETYLRLTDYHEVVQAIREMRVRGAPALGVTAAYGIVLGAMGINAKDLSDFKAQLSPVCDAILQSRPTAVNIRWAIDRMMGVVNAQTRVSGISERLLAEALYIQQEDEEINRRIGTQGAQLLLGQKTVMTHCNAGALATAGYGTALGVIRASIENGNKKLRVLATETRPFLQGARLTSWELAQDEIDVTLITDSMAGHFLKEGNIDCVIVGADRIAANGDVANKIGTYSIAVLARENSVPFYVAAPVSTIDLLMTSGDGIPIEERSEEEVLHYAGVRIAPIGVKAANPAFDVTPNRFVSAIVTEIGIAREPYKKSLKDLFTGRNAMETGC